MLYRIMTGLDQDKHDDPIDPELRDTTEEWGLLYLALHLGGGTAIRTQGSYKHLDGYIVTERGLLFEVYAPIEDEDKVRDFAAELRYRLDQESVMFMVHPVNSTEFV